ncbi:Aldo/keto reductase, partial [Pseudovirgaria hyperparasitica]
MAFEVMDRFFSGNFIDTSNNYANGESERIIGSWMTSRSNRDQIVLATKFSSPYLLGQGYDTKHSNFAGNSTKSLKHSVDASLAKLQTSYIDILYIHWWDWTMSIPELMLSLNALLNQGKVLYLGASDMPAYVVAKANQYARDHGLRGFVVYQGRWSAANRDFERDVLHLARDEGMAIAPWGALGSGQFRTDAMRKEAEANGEKVRMSMGAMEGAVAVSKALENIAKKKGNVPMTSVALAYVMHKAPYVFPVVGCRKLEHLDKSIEAVGLKLEDDEIKEIEESSPFDPGFPLNAFGARPAENWMLNMAGVFDYVPPVQSISL